MSKYKIGIPAWKTGDNSFGVTVPYIRFIEYFGEPVILAPTSEINEDLDLILVPGGPDVSPDKYSQTPDYYTGKPCIFREHFDNVHLPKYIQLGTPVFGICRGMQSLSVMHGAQMEQHISHVANKQFDRTEIMHSVSIIGKFTEKLVNNLGFRKHAVPVNSIHHQTVDKDSMERSDLELIGTSHHKDERGYDYPEIVAHPTLPIVGVQWHPEEIYDEFSVKTINYLLETGESILV